MMQKRQLIEGLTAELYGLVGTISVYKRDDTLCLEREHEQIKTLRKEAFEMSEDEVRKRFQNLRVKLQIKHMLGLRSVRCQYSTRDGKMVLTEFHTGDPVMLTHPIDLPKDDELRYIRITGKVINILGDSTLIVQPDNMLKPDGNAC